MSDPIRVRFPCQHGILFRHMIRPVGIKPVWCEGGQTKLLREYTRTIWCDTCLDRHEDYYQDESMWVVWVEVEE